MFLISIFIGRQNCPTHLFFENVVALKRAVLVVVSSGLLGSGVLGDGLGALADGVLGELSWQEQTHCSLNLAAADGRLLVVECQTRRL